MIVVENFELAYLYMMTGPCSLRGAVSWATVASLRRENCLLLRGNYSGLLSIPDDSENHGMPVTHFCESAESLRQKSENAQKRRYAAGR